MKRKSIHTERFILLGFLSFIFLIQMCTSSSLLSLSNVSQNAIEPKKPEIISDDPNELINEIEPPKAALRDYTESYEFKEYPVFDDFTDPTTLPNWHPSYTIGIGSSGFGSIVISDGLYLKGETQEVSVGGYTVPEMPDSLSIQSGNLMTPEHPWGTGRLQMYFAPNGLQPLIKTYTINGIPIPYVLISKFGVYIRTDPNADPLANEIYSYSPGLGDPNTPQLLNLQLEGAGATSYFEVIFYLLTYTKDQWVKVDYIDINCYDMNWTEGLDYIPSDWDQNITVNFRQTYFSRATSGSTVEVFVNNQGSVVDASCSHYSAAGDNTNPYMIVIPNTVYQAGDVFYRIRFQSTAGDYLWTPTYTFYCYDNDEPWFGTPTYNVNQEYQNNLDIYMPVYDTGGSNLKNAKIVWDYGTDPANDASNYLWNVNALSGDADTAHFVIPSSSLQYSARVGQLRFKIFVYDNAYYIEPAAITSNISIVYGCTIVDNIAPQISVELGSETSFRWVESANKYIQDLGYDLLVKFSITEPEQASQIDTATDLYISIQDDTMPTGAPWGTKQTLDGPSSTTKTYYFRYSADLMVGSDHWFYFTIFAKDIAGNSATNNKTYAIYVADLRGPDVIEGVNNTRNPDFDQDYFLYFNASEPAKALGVTPATIELKYVIGSFTDFNASATTATIYEDLSSGPNYIYRYRIQKSEMNFQYGSNITYRYRVRDLIGNLQEIERTVYITDRYVPNYTVLTERTISNWTITYSFWDVSFVVDASDQIGGSGIDYLKLYLKNGSNAIYAAGQPNQSPFSPYKIESGRYYFLIPESKISYHGISIALRVYDKAGNYQEWIQNIDVQDNNRPEMLLYRLDVVNEVYLNKETTYFYFKLSQSAWVTCYVDGKCIQEMTATNNLSKTLSVKGEGSHMITVQFNDFLWIKTVIVDLTAPGKVEATVEKIGLLHQITWKLPTNISSGEKIKYLVYRGTTENFTIENAILVTETTGFLYAYPFDESGTFYYKVIAVDQALNYSPLSDATEGIDQVKSTSIATGFIIAGIAVALVFSSFLIVKRYKKFYGLEKFPTPKFIVKLKQGYVKTKQAAQKMNTKVHKFKNAVDSAMKTNATPTDVQPVKSTTPVKSPILASPPKPISAKVEESGWESPPKTPEKSDSWQDFSTDEDVWDEPIKKAGSTDNSPKSEETTGWDDAPDSETPKKTKKIDP